MKLESLLDAKVLSTRIAELGKSIREEYGENEPIVCLGVLKGSFVFMADLIRAIEGPVECMFLGVASYEGTETTGRVRITHDLSDDIGGRHVLVVEDIVDTGLTMDYLLNTLRAREPASLKVCTLLDKPSRRRTEVPLDFVGFGIEDLFVVGYGLDLDQRYRNLPYVGVFRQ